MQVPSKGPVEVTRPLIRPQNTGTQTAPKPSTYAWIITRDLITDGEAGVMGKGTTGPRNASSEMLELAEGPKGRTFRIYDDDGEHYYTGRIYSSEGPGSEDDFGPLDDFGAPNAGATEIRYYNGQARKWESL